LHKKKSLSHKGSAGVAVTFARVKQRSSMHYGIIAIGSRGDVQPFVALSLGLKEKNHRVTLMAHGNFKSFVEGYGIDYRPLAGNTEEMLQAREGLRLLQSGNTFRLLRYIRKGAGRRTCSSQAPSACPG
jgi:UDP:flavonoid glycosyltransferase YjiC (YdhE family)